MTNTLYSKKNKANFFTHRIVTFEKTQGQKFKFKSNNRIVKNIIEFVQKIDSYNIYYNLSKEGEWNSIIFYKVYPDFKPVLFDYIKSEMNSSENDYYTIIIAFILFNNI